MSTKYLSMTIPFMAIFVLSLICAVCQKVMLYRKRSALMKAMAKYPPARAPCNWCTSTTCDHQSTVSSLLPYASLASVWVSEMTQQNRQRQRPAVHTNQQCNNSCENCKQLQQPPPSYTNLFPDENPPSYSESVGLPEKEGAGGVFTSKGQRRYKSRSQSVSQLEVIKIGFLPRKKMSFQLPEQIKDLKEK